MYNSPTIPIYFRKNNILPDSLEILFFFFFFFFPKWSTLVEYDLSRDFNLINSYIYSSSHTWPKELYIHIPTTHESLDLKFCKLLLAILYLSKYSSSNKQYY